MDNDNININRLTCRFENKSLEKEYLKHSWEKTWKYTKILLSVNVPVSLAIILDDLFVQGVGSNKYYLSYHLFAIVFLFLYLFSSFETKRKYHQTYFLISAIGS